MFKDFFLHIQLLSENAKMPTRATIGDAGLDLYTPKDIIIAPFGDSLIPLDIRIEMPLGFAMIIKEKSGIATKKKLSIGAGLIDAYYRGNCHVHLFNHSNEEVYFNKGDKLAQAIIIPIWDGIPKQVNFIDINTERSNNGFGSTGI